MDNPATNATIAVGVMNVSGSGGGYQISLTFAADITPGDYDIMAAGDVVGTCNNAAVNPPLFSGTSGTLTIVTHDIPTSTVEGTFNFSGDNGSGATVEITAGSFNLTY